MRVMMAMILAVAAATPSLAQTSAPMAMGAGDAVCPATPVALPPALAGWNTPRPVTAATQAGELALATLTIGQGARATLAPTARVVFPLAPSHPGAPDSASGLFAFTVTQAARYRVALGAGAWVDVVGDGRAVTSVAHAHGPACSGIHKMVDFDLAPGKYVLQVVGSDVPVLTLMVAKLPA